MMLCLMRARTDPQCALLCTAMDKKLIPLPPAISIQDLKTTMKMTWLHKFFGLFCYSGQLLSQIGPTADFDVAAIPPLIFSMDESDFTLSISKARLISLPLFRRIFSAIMINISIGTITRRTYTINQFGYNAI